MISNYQHLDKKPQENKPTTTLLRRQLGGRDFNFTHLTRPSCQVSVESVSFRIPWQISSPSVAASNGCKPGCLEKKTQNTGGDQEETEPGRQQPRTMKPIRPHWEQTPPTFEPLNCREENWREKSCDLLPRWLAILSSWKVSMSVWMPVCLCVALW